MKKLIFVGAITVIILLIFNACGNKTASTSQIESEKTVYTCPMHSEVISDKPGNCPKCGMKLIKKEVVSSDSTQIEHMDSIMD